MNQLIAELDGFAEDLARDGAAGVNLVASASQQLERLERENTQLRNEIARLNSQTNWVCKCGGTDCEGQKENAALREDKERLDWLGKTKCAYFHEGPFVWRINEDETTDGDTIRAAIDAARKEAQP
jgi:hypothetical protein